MVNQQLLDYIKQQLASGVAKENIKTALISQGWSEPDANEGFMMVEKSATPSASQIPTPTPAQPNDRTLLYISCSLYLASLFLPAVDSTSGGIDDFGISILIYGWMGLLMGVFAWFANVFGLIAFLLAGLKNYRTALILSGIAFIIGLDSFSIINESIPLDNGSSTMTGLGPGFYLWMSSFLLTFIYCFIQLRKVRKA